MFGKYRTIIIVVVILGIAFVAYTLMRRPSTEDDLLTSDLVSPTVTTEIVGAEIISALNQIESLRLSDEIFRDPVFLSLTDRSQDIPPEPVGKKNPFDPISSSAPEPASDQPTITETVVPRNSIIRPPAQPVI